MVACVWVDSSTGGPIEIHLRNLIRCLSSQHIREQRAAQKAGKAGSEWNRHSTVYAMKGTLSARQTRTVTIFSERAS